MSTVQTTDQTRTVINRDKLYLNGQWVTPNGQGMIDVVDPSTEGLYARIPEGSIEDANTAVLAARNAFDAWSSLSGAERAVYLEKIAAGLKARSAELSATIACEVGMPLKMASMVQVAGPVWNWGNYAKLAREFEFESKLGHSLILREAIGVVSAITPWNFPLNQITLKVAAALAAGCTVVLKPSEVAPINAFILTDVIQEAGLPAGVFNLVTGYGPVVGEVLASHPEVDMVSFTGSTGAGKRVAQLAAQTVKKVALELGGKSAAIILDSADLKSAVKATVMNCFLNSGQTCSATTRMLVPRVKLSQALEYAKEVAQTCTLGPALGEGSRLGPLVSDIQRGRVRAYIQKGIAQGAQLVTGGSDAPEQFSTGFFVQPTVLAVNSSKDTIAQEEIFGPVLTVIPFDSESQAIDIANDSPYGLGGAVFAASDELAIKVAKKIRTGQININAGQWNAHAPFGGYKQSGVGRENGLFGMEEFLEFKSLQLSA
jgi:aldehyde dehydrogenase (NAD+)